MGSNSDLIMQTATELKKLLLQKSISPFDLIDALETRISEVNPTVNALPTLCLDRARDHAARIVDMAPEQRGSLCGLPVAIKDLEPVAGVRTTWGSQIYADFVPTASDCLVDMLEDSDGIIYAKTNTPEFGAGANTFNEVFGKTVNPWNTSKSCAGSSGGSAVALATGMAWLASGSDLGGSLRNPASFCSVVGFRPSPGRVPHGASRPGAYPPDLGGLLNDPFGVAGPMARNVPDLALLLDAMTGHHRADGISLPREAMSYVEAIDSAKAPVRVAFSPDLGITPVDPEVATICETAARHFESLGCEVEQAHPDFSNVQDIFQTNRAISFYVAKRNLLKSQRDKLKPEVIWNIEKARDISLDDIARVEDARADYTRRATDFFDDYDLLLSPATIVPPYPIEQRYVESCNGIEFDNYIEWCTIAYAITITGFPVMSVPAGFTDAGLPVGLQLIAGPRREAELLRAAKLYEDLSGLSSQVPIDPRPDN